jgi:hypothetical protein
LQNFETLFSVCNNICDSDFSVMKTVEVIMHRPAGGLVRSHPAVIKLLDWVLPVRGMSLVMVGRKPVRAAVRQTA